MAPLAKPLERRCNQPFNFVTVSASGDYLLCCQDGMQKTRGMFGNILEGEAGFKREAVAFVPVSGLTGANLVRGAGELLARGGGGGGGGERGGCAHLLGGRRVHRRLMAR